MDFHQIIWIKGRKSPYYPNMEFTTQEFRHSAILRDDMEVLDKPLYANFLRVTGLDRPYMEELMSKTVRLQF
ncbi:hypothetical protein QN277_008936 [Acacia crassicarpa]|uniref:Uncharacterized protein n=1 Tax=Acacia crassicarpa TaxID=499986 RepID=A0AAE1M7X7_9FABA|nr:hypothetical protein QN277_008936 [Acacia crassicarpa]